jgi:hypothetical protein
MGKIKGIAQHTQSKQSRHNQRSEARSSARKKRKGYTDLALGSTVSVGLGDKQLDGGSGASTRSEVAYGGGMLGQSQHRVSCGGGY